MQAQWAPPFAPHPRPSKKLAKQDALLLELLLDGDPRLLLAGEMDRLMGELGARGGPGLGASSPGIAYVSARTEALKNAGKPQEIICQAFGDDIFLRFVHGDRVGDDLITNPVTNLARQYGTHSRYGYTPGNFRPTVGIPA